MLETVETIVQLVFAGTLLLVGIAAAILREPKVAILFVGLTIFLLAVFFSFS
jgi:hypothetical protein